MKKLTRALIYCALLLAVACRKDKAVQPAPAVHSPIMTPADTSGVSGPKDPTKPPPHN